MTELEQIEFILTQVNYDPEDGRFRWKPLEELAKIRKTRRGLHYCKEYADIYRGRRKIYRALRCKAEGTYRQVLAHRAAFIAMGCPLPIEVDHRDGDYKNNQWKNLRDSTKSINMRNRVAYGKTSRFKGVVYCSNSKTWGANGRNAKNKFTRLGRYEEEIEAAKVYDDWIVQQNLPGAIINFPDRYPNYIERRSAVRDIL